MSKNLPALVAQNLSRMTDRKGPVLNYQLNGMREVVEGFAKAAKEGQISIREGMDHCTDYVRHSLDAEYKSRMRPFREERQALQMASEQLGKEIGELQEILRFQSPIKEIRRIVHRQRWSTFIKVTFYLMMAAAMFAGLFGVLNASKALISSQVGFFGHEVQAFIVSMILLAPPLALKGFIGLVPEFKMIKIMRALFLGLIISLFAYVALFAYVNAPSPIEATGLFNEEPIPPSRIPSILLLFCQISLEMFTTASLMAVCMVLEKKHSETLEEPGLEEHPDYQRQKSKLLELQSLDQSLSTRMNLIDSFQGEHALRVSALSSEAQNIFLQKMRSI